LETNTWRVEIPARILFANVASQGSDTSDRWQRYCSALGSPWDCDRMPSNTEGLYTDSRQEFCRALKAARERKGISLDVISEATKVASSYFVALERGDVSRWPTGIFRRSFFRDYVRAIGLPMEETCDAFVRMFPDEGQGLLVKPDAPAAPAPSAPADQARLAFDAAWHGPRTPILSRLLAAFIDLVFVGIAAASASWALGAEVPVTAAIAAAAYFSLSTLCLGQTPAAWVIAHRRVLPDVLARGPAVLNAVWTRRSEVMTNIFGNAGTGRPAPEDEAAERVWVTDARRVGPPQLRVRIKLPQ
jgi:hypothetical protein